jgi:putative redox protein
MQASVEPEEEEGEKEHSKRRNAISGEYPVTLDWVRNMQFIAHDDKNHSVVLDTSPESGGENSGPTPGRLLLMAVAGCTAMDVVDILVKSRQKLTGLRISSRGVQNQEYPKYYKEIHLKYHLKGIQLDKSRVERAIKLSEEKYCSVGATVSGKAKIFIRYEIEEQE